MGFDYEGALEVERAWREGLTPDPLLTVSEWADRHRVLCLPAPTALPPFPLRRSPTTPRLQGTLFANRVPLHKRRNFDGSAVHSGLDADSDRFLT
jgi:hypothetical protein